MAISQSGSLLLPRIESDRNGSYISVECGSVSGQLYIDQLPKERAKHVGQCVLSASKWIIPLEFERLGGKSAKKWKSSLFMVVTLLVTTTLCVLLLRHPQHLLHQMLLCRLRVQ